MIVFSYFAVVVMLFLGIILLCSRIELRVYKYRKTKTQNNLGINYYSRIFEHSTILNNVKVSDVNEIFGNASVKNNNE